MEKKNNKLENKLKDVDIEEYIKVEPINSNKKERKSYQYEIRLIFNTLLIVIFLFLSIFFLEKSISIQKEETIYYKEISYIDYKVKVKENNYYDTTYLDKNMSYIASLIDTINLKFNYILDSNHLLEGDYEYNIVGELEILNSENNELFFSKEYPLVNNKILHIEDKNKISIYDELDINYNYYNNIANSFKSNYGVNTNSSLKVKMIINRKLDEDVLKTDKLNGKSEISLVIPLSEKALSIKMDSNNINNSNEILVANKKLNFKDYIYFIIGIIFIIISIYKLYKLIMLIEKSFTKPNSYDKYVKRILNNYDRLIVNVKTEIDFNKYNVIEVKSFDELLDAKDNMHRPIYFIEVTKHIKCHFYVKNDNDIILYTVKNIDLENK